MFKETLIVVVALLAGIESSPLKRDLTTFRWEHITSWPENPFKSLVLVYGDICCTGSTYNSRTVISSGRCFINPENVAKHVYFAYANAQNNSEVNIDIDRVSMPSDYQLVDGLPVLSGHNIAVVILKAGINFNCIDQAVILPSNLRPVVGTEVIIAGYCSPDENQELNAYLSKGSLVVNRCPNNPKDGRICATRNEASYYQSSVFVTAGSPIMSILNGEYVTHGFLSGTEIYPGYVRVDVFAAYRTHEKFIHDSIVTDCVF